MSLVQLHPATDITPMYVVPRTAATVGEALCAIEHGAWVAHAHSEASYVSQSQANSVASAAEPFACSLGDSDADDSSQPRTPPQAPVPAWVTPFHSSAVVPMQLQEYALKLAAVTGYGAPGVQLALRLMQRYEQTVGRPLTLLMVHRLYAACLHLAAKTHFDEFLANSIFARMAGVQLAELNDMEFTLLTALDFRVMELPNATA